MWRRAVIATHPHAARRMPYRLCISTAAIFASHKSPRSSLGLTRHRVRHGADPAGNVVSGGMGYAYRKGSVGYKMEGYSSYRKACTFTVEVFVSDCNLSLN